jgi:hypothetical protein
MGVGFWPTLTTGTGATTEIVGSGVASVLTAFSYVVRKHGRKFLGPLIEDVLVGGYISAAFMISVGASLAAWISPFTGGTSSGGWVPGIWDRLVGFFYPFRDAVARDVPGYQRRRKAGVGS